MDEEKLRITKQIIDKEIHFSSIPRLTGQN